MMEALARNVALILITLGVLCGIAIGAGGLYLALYLMRGAG